MSELLTDLGREGCR